MSQSISGIKLLTRDQISNEKWDLLCQNLEYPIFNSSWYLDAVCPDWQAFVLNDYDLALPVFPNSKFGLMYSLQPLFVRSVSIMGKDLSKQYEFLKYVYQYFSFFELNFENQSYSEDTKFQGLEKSFQILNFSGSYDEIRQSYSENAKRKLKQFQKWETIIESSDNLDDLITLFKNEKGKDIDAFNDVSYTKLKKIMSNALFNNYGNVYSVKLNGEIVAIGFFIHNGSHLLYLKGTVTKKGKEIGAMYGLFDFIIDKYHSEYSRLDFGGSSDGGVAAFNKKFGACDMKYLILKKNNLIWPLNQIIKSKLGI